MHTLNLNFQNIDIWLLISRWSSSRGSNRNYRKGNYWLWWLRNNRIICKLNICNALLTFNNFGLLLAKMNYCYTRRLLLNLNGLWSNTLCDWGLINSRWSIAAYWSARTAWLCWECVIGITYLASHILFNCISIFEIVSENTKSYYCFKWSHSVFIFIKIFFNLNVKNGKLSY